MSGVRQLQKAKAPIERVQTEYDRHGNERLYIRKKRSGPRIRVRGPLGSEEFWEDYLKAADAFNDTPDLKIPHAQTIRFLCEKYMKSGLWQSYQSSTQNSRRLILNRFCDDYGDLSYKKLSTLNLSEIQDRMANNPGAANYFIKILRQVFSHAKRRIFITHNPAKDVDYLPIKNKDGFHLWSISEVEKFEIHFPIGATARLAFAIMLYTGLRRSDACRVGRQHVDNRLIRMRLKKGGKLHVVPIVNELQEIIDATPTGDMSFVQTSFGKPFTANGFGNRMRKWCDEVDLPPYSSHGLRKAMAVRLCHLGFTTKEIMAFGGWDSIKQVELYTRGVEKELLLESGLLKLNRD